MKVVLSTIGRFHVFNLALELYRRGVLKSVFTGYPRFKLNDAGIPHDMIRTYPWFHAPYMAFSSKFPYALKQQWENVDAVTFAAFVKRNLPECDLYVGHSGSGLEAGRLAHKRGARYICDRGSAHIRLQDRLLREEHDLWGMPFSGIDPRTIAREEAEYDEADRITIPSAFAYRSFVEQGISAEKLRLLPYGVDVSRFQPVSKPVEDKFDVLFVGGMSLRKGVQYLVQAYQRINHPAKSLTFIGAPSPDLIALLIMRGLWPADARVLGAMPQAELKNIMSLSHVLVLPSIEDGFGMVMAQAMACGCPVIASRNTGGEDLFSDGREGYIVPIRDVDALAGRMQQMADNPDQRANMGKCALEHVRNLGGWHSYGETAMAIYDEVLKK